MKYDFPKIDKKLDGKKIKLNKKKKKKEDKILVDNNSNDIYSDILKNKITKFNVKNQLSKKIFHEKPYFDESKNVEDFGQNLDYYDIYKNTNNDKTTEKENVILDRTSVHYEDNTLIKDNAIEKNNNNTRRDSNMRNQPYELFDENYNVQLKFLIYQEGKLHEIQFTYNLIKDNIKNLMEEIKNEFNFSIKNLNHIYEELKKISIYAKFYKTSDKFPDNSF